MISWLKHRCVSLYDGYLWAISDLNIFGKMMFTPLFVMVLPLLFIIECGFKRDRL